MSGEFHWYVVRGEEQAGPFTDTQLRAYAEKGDLKPDDQVWRPGFENWQRAGDVPGLLQPPKIVRPPPPRPAPPPPPLQNPSREKQAAPQGAIPDPKLVGVWGWLLLLCVGLTILGPLASMGEIAKSYQQTKALFSTVAGLESFFIAVLVLSVVQILASFCIGVMLWSRQPGAHRFAQWFLLGNTALTCVAPFLIYLFVDMPAGSGGQVLSESLPDIFRTAVPSLIWYWYLEKSKRVRATYAEL
jgi:hypothetical protein